MPLPSNELLSPEHRCSVGAGQGSKVEHTSCGGRQEHSSLCRDGGSAALSVLPSKKVSPVPEVEAVSLISEFMVWGK